MRYFALTRLSPTMVNVFECFELRPKSDKLIDCHAWHSHARNDNF
ncbi:hypothetical protein [Helicobacter sp. T3_23-1059]